MKCCKNCGKELSEGIVVCPACGYSVEEETKIENVSRNENRGKVLSILSLLSGIASFFFGIPFGILFGIIAIVLAHISKEDTENVLCSTAKAGKKCGIISIILWVSIFVIVIVWSLSTMGNLFSFMDSLGSYNSYGSYDSNDLYDSDDLYYSDDLYADYDSDDLYDNYGSYSSYYR